MEKKILELLLKLKNDEKMLIFSASEAEAYNIKKSIQLKRNKQACILDSN
jgi:hypothetical protein